MWTFVDLVSGESKCHTKFSSSSFYNILFCWFVNTGLFWLDNYLTFSNNFFMKFHILNCLYINKRCRSDEDYSLSKSPWSNSFCQAAPCGYSYSIKDWGLIPTRSPGSCKEKSTVHFFQRECLFLHVPSNIRNIIFLRFLKKPIQVQGLKKNIT